MTDFRTVPGFEDVWRAPARTRIVHPQAGRSPPPQEGVRARLQRIVDRAPEVMVKVTGRTRDVGHLCAHFEYIARNGQLELEGSAGEIMVGRQALADLADTWAACDQFDSRRRTNSPVSLSVVLSMPAGTDAAALYDAARAFAADTLAGRHDYVFTLHTDTPRPHVHLSIHARGHAGERLNPKKADLDAWRRAFAQALRDRGVEAEATPRRARGVTRKAERGPIRRLRERQAKAGADPGRVRLSVLRDAAQAAFQGDTALRHWELNLVRRQQRIRALYLAQAKALQQSEDHSDQALGRKLQTFVLALPSPDSQRLDLARQMRAANARLAQERPQAPKQRDR